MQKQTGWIVLFLAPTLLMITLIAGYPLLQTFIYSFTNITLSNVGEYLWVGFSNYQYILTDSLWWVAVWNTILFTIFTVSLETILGLVVALFLNHSFKGRGLMRVAVLIPWAIPTVVSSKIWEWLYHDKFGFINELLLVLNLIDKPIAFMGSSSITFWSIIAVDIWKTTPFMALLILAGLSTIPKDLYEAAKIDGSNPVKSFFYITLPLLRNTILIALIFRSLDALRVFDIIYVMQGSNDNTASISIYARQQMIDFQQIGIGASASFLVFVLISLFTAGYIYFGKLNLQVEK